MSIIKRFKTFNPNTFTDEQYEQFNIKVVHHFFARDEFIMRNGEIYTMEQANEYIKNLDPDWYEHASRTEISDHVGPFI